MIATLPPTPQLSPAAAAATAPPESAPDPAGLLRPSPGAAAAPSVHASAPDAAPEPEAVADTVVAPEPFDADIIDSRPPVEAAPAAAPAPPPPAAAAVRFGARPRPRSSRERADRQLFERFAATRDPADRDAIIERFLPLARQLAASYQRPYEPFEDIYQVACYGLIKAVDRFELARGRAFTSYAVPTIVGEIKRHFRDRTWAVRVPRDLQELSLRVDRTVGELTRRLGRQPSVAEVAEAVDVEPEHVLEAMEAGSAYRTNSLDAPRAGGDEDDGATLGDTLGAADDGFERAEERVLIADLLRSLPVREQQVIQMRFDDELTQAEIGERIGVSQMQVSRILRSTLARLHTLVTEGEARPPRRSRSGAAVPDRRSE